MSIISRNYVECKSSDLIHVDPDQRFTKHEIYVYHVGVGLSFQREEKCMLLTWHDFLNCQYQDYKLFLKNKFATGKIKAKN